MAVPNQTPYNIYTANGVTTIFPYEFYLINAGDLTVSLDGGAVSTGFTVTGIGNVNGGEVTFLTPPANDVIVMLERVVAPVRLTEYQDNGDLLADTVNLDFDRLWMAIKQSFVSLGVALLRPVFGGPFNAKGYRIASLADPVNDQDAATKGYANTLDKKTNQHIETLNNATNNRALRVPEAVISPLPNAATRAGKMLSFDALGAPIAALPPTGTAADVLTELAKSDGATKIGSRKHSVQQALDEKFDKTGGTVNGEIISQGGQISLKGDNRKYLGFHNQDGSVRMWIYKDKGGDGVRLHNGNDGGGEYVFHKDGGFRAPSSVYAGAARMAADGNIHGSQWGNQGLDAYLSKTFQPKGAGQAYTKEESDARYVRDVQRGAATSPPRINVYGPGEAPIGCVLTRAWHDGGDAYGVFFTYRPLQIYINGAWRTISDISDSK